VAKLKKGDLVVWRRPRWTRPSSAHRGIVLGEAGINAYSYRVRWLTGSGGVGTHYQDDLIKIEVESD
jgi:hypothetical protein